MIIEENIDAHLQSMERDAHFRGVVLVVKKAIPVFCKAYGYASTSTKNKISTIFHIGSLTKQFTAAAILLLVEMGKIKLDESVTQYLPDCEKWEKVKVLHLLAHTSGINNYTDWDNYWKISKNLTSSKIIQIAKNQKLQFQPGSDFEYSNTGFVILGAIIEVQSGCSYAEFIKKNILEPSDMRSSGVHDENCILNANMARGYCLNDEGEDLIEDHSENIAATSSDGSMYSTVEDLAKWSDVLDGKSNVLSKKILNLMMKPGQGGYGYGLEIDKIWGEKRVQHSGSIAGFNSYFCKYLENNLLIIALSNNLNFDTHHIIGEISKLLLKKEPMTISVKFLEDFTCSDYEGFFESEDDSYEFYLKRNDRLFVDDSPPSECIFLSNGHIYNPAMGLEFALKRGAEQMAVYDGYGKEVDVLDRC